MAEEESCDGSADHKGIKESAGSSIYLKGKSVAMKVDWLADGRAG